jgi:hypothetical protein
MSTIFSAVLRQQWKSDVMTCFGRSTRSAVYYEADSPLIPNSDWRLFHLVLMSIGLNVATQFKQ